MIMSFLHGPESLAVQADFLYAATADGVYQVVFFLFSIYDYAYEMFLKFSSTKDISLVQSYIRQGNS